MLPKKEIGRLFAQVIIALNILPCPLHTALVIFSCSSSWSEFKNQTKLGMGEDNNWYNALLKASCDHAGTRFWYCGPGGSCPRWSPSGWTSRTHLLAWRIKVMLNAQKAELIGLDRDMPDTMGNGYRGINTEHVSGALRTKKIPKQYNTSWVSWKPNHVERSLHHHEIMFMNECTHTWAFGYFWHFWRGFTAG